MAEAGADTFVAGTAIFGHAEPVAAARAIRGGRRAAAVDGRMSEPAARARRQAKVVTVSDGVMAGTREDRSGAAAGARRWRRPGSRWWSGR